MQTQLPSSQPRSCAGERGMALVTVMLVTMLCAALMVGFTSAIVSDQRSSGLDRDQTQAYAVAHAGLEKLTSDLSALFRTDFSPNSTQINALTATGNRPQIHSCPNPPCSAVYQYTSPGGGSGYAITFTPDASGNPAPESVNGSAISSGPYQGFMGLITPYDLTVTARSTGGGEVRLRRTLQTVAIPVFQFGMFSETDLGFHAGEPFNFGGRVHTNGNLYLAQADGSALTIGDRVTAVGEIIRTHLPNDLPVGSGYSGTVNVPTVIKLPTNTNRALATTEGSLRGTSGKPSDASTSAFWTTKNGSWDTISTGTYKSNIRNGTTGARRLDLPLVGDANGDGNPDAMPIELIRRPRVNSNENTTANFLYQQRYFAQASLRILLSDDISDIQNLPTVTQGSQPILLNPGVDYAPHIPAGGTKSPIAAADAHNLVSGTGPIADVFPAGTYRANAGQPVLGGYIKIEMQRQDGTYSDVTAEILGLGISGRNLADVNTAAATTSNANQKTALTQRLNKLPDAGDPVCQDVNPNAVIRLQRMRDVPGNATASIAANVNTNASIASGCGYTVNGANQITAVSQTATDYWPNVLYDTREAQVRDGIDNADTDLVLGGVMHYVELDMNNLRRWLLGQIGTTGNQARNDNGFVIYFSDRRNNNNGADNSANNETAEYGYEDTINPGTAAGTPNGVWPGNTTTGLDPGEDLQQCQRFGANTVCEPGQGTLQIYGSRPALQNIPLGNSLACLFGGLGAGVAPLDCNARVTTSLDDATVTFGGSTAAQRLTLRRLVARANKAIFFRRALKIVNGGIQTAATANSCTATLAAPCNNVVGPGVTIASENPVYLQGNFNATAASANVEPNVAAAVIADSVTLLSNNWSDLRSFLVPTDSTQRQATATGYRLAIVTGKTRAFPRPTAYAVGGSFGSDGGAHNFVRNLEDWDTAGTTQRYRGSFVSFFYSRQATGIFKCCSQDVYNRGPRDWSFDTDFLLPSLLPPGTPMFRDVNTLTFRQILRPTQQ